MKAASPIPSQALNANRVSRDFSFNHGQETNTNSSFKNVSGISNTSSTPTPKTLLGTLKIFPTVLNRFFKSISNRTENAQGLSMPRSMSTRERSKNAVSQADSQHNAVDVRVGRAMTQSDPHSTMHTTLLSHSSVLVLLSKFNGTFYEDRTMLHLMSSDLKKGLAPDHSHALEKISALLDKPNDTVKVILAVGKERAYESDLQTYLLQHKPLLELMKSTHVSAKIGGCKGIQVGADGIPTFQESKGYIDEVGTKLFLNRIK